MKKALLLSFALFIMHIAYGQLTGVKTIPGDYTSIEAAILALNSSGVGSGGVTFDIAAGHTETFSTPTAGLITAFGTAANQIIFQKSGGGANPLITAATPGAGTMDYVICLWGADYVTFDGIDIQENVTNTTSAEQMEWAYAILKVSVTDGSQNNTIKNCDITLNPANTSSRAIYSNNHTTTSTTQLVITDISGTNSNNKFYGLNVSNCYHAFYIYGRADASPYTYYDQNNELGVDGANTINGLGGSSTSSYGLYCYYQNGVKIANNTYTGTSNQTTGSQYVMYISTGTRSNVDIYNNTVSMTALGTGTFYALYCSQGSSGIDNTVNVYNNNIINNSLPNKGSGTVYMCYVSTGAVTANFYGNNISNNTIGSNSATSTGSIYYARFSSSPSSAGTMNVYNNTVSNNARIQSSPGSGTTYIFYTAGTAGGASGVLDVHDNSVSNITVSSTSTCYGFYNSFSGGTKNVYDNSLTNIMGANGTSVYGFYSSSGTAGNYYNNMIQNLNKISASGTLYGFYVSSGVNISVYNNFISELYAPVATTNPAIRGIHFNGGTSHGCYNNTVYLDASSSSSSFGTAGIYASSTPIVELRNNIVVNESTPGATGLTVAYRRSSTNLATYATTSNNNNFFAGTPGPGNLIFYDGTNADQTLGDFQARVSPADASSVSEISPFFNITTPPYDLHMRTDIPTQMESGGGVVDTPVNITTDYDGDARYPNAGYPDNAGFPAAAPDIGADEFGGLGLDLTPPNISFTPLQNTASLIARTLVTSITDATGVPTAGTGLPVLYWKINSGSYTPVTATWVSADEYTFTFGSGVVLGDIVSYYIVAQDEVTPTPNVGASPSGGATGFTINPPACSTPPEPPMTYTILGSICGTFQVGAGQTYTTITEAIADLALNEVTCPVIFELTDATYSAETLPIELVPFAGGSTVNTVTIKPAAGITPTITGSSATAIFKFVGGQYYVIDGSNMPGGNDRSLTIENTGTSTSTATIWFSSQGVDQGSMNNVVKNCNILGGSNTVTSIFGITFSGTTISTSGRGVDNDNNTIENNKISRVYYGIFAYGEPSVGEMDNLVIKDNIIGGDVEADYVTGYGMRFSAINGAAVTGNEIYNMIRNGSKYAMYMYTYVSNSLFDNNTIHAMGHTNTSSYYCVGMYFSSTTGATNNQVSNNTIYDFYNYGSTSLFYGPVGIRVIGGSNYKIWHNSISFTAAFGSSTAGVYSHCLYISSATTNMDLRDNIFHNTMTGNNPRAYTVYTPNTSTFAPINFNDYYTTSSAFGYYGAEVADFSAWQVATGQDGASMNINPLFVSSTDLHPTNVALDNFGTYIPEVPKDFDGVTRTNPPDMGAYEFGTNPTVTTLAASDVDCESGTLNGTINPNGLTVSTYFDYGPTTSYGTTVDGNPDIVTGSTPVDISAAIAMPPGTTWHYRLRGVTAGGVTVYGDDMTITTSPTGPPLAITEIATNITDFGATLNGTVNAYCDDATVTFEYGYTMGYGYTVAADQSPVSGGANTAVSVDVAGLTLNTEYHFRVVAVNTSGTTYGDDMTFTTGANPPIVTTDPASDVGNFTAHLHGTVDASNQETTVTFEWGETIFYGNIIGGTPGTVTGNTPTAVMADLAGLNSNTEYHFRCVGVNAAGTTYGLDEMFTTSCPVPDPAGTISGPISVCQSSSGHVYSIAPILYATGYTWSLPAGGTITAGDNTYSITVSYDNMAVSGDVSVFGTSVCGNGAASNLAVSVNPVPVPTITGPDMACISSSYVYSTEAGMTAYTWTVSAGGQIMSGAGTNEITIKWNNEGAQYVTVDYTSSFGCPAAAPTTLNVMVSTLPTPTIVGSNLMCVNSGLHVYTSEGGFSDYVWAVTSGGTIVSGQGTYQIEVDWHSDGSQTVSVNYSNSFGCTASSSATFAVTVMPLPGDAGTITGTSELCAGTQAVNYTVTPISDVIDYIWTLPAGATIVEGENTNSIRVDFALDAVTGDISVYGENLCGMGQVSPPFGVTVNPIPPTPVASMDEFFMLHSDAPEGNQWYFNGDMIDGATGQDYQAEEEGTYYTIVTLNGCVSEMSNEIEVIFTGLDELSSSSFRIYPVPNDGRFTFTIVIKGEDTFNIKLFNDLGVKVYEMNDFHVDGKAEQDIDLHNPSTGIYTIIFQGNDQTVIRKVLVTN